MNNRQKGQLYEYKTSLYLKKLGYTILNMNYSCKVGEVDIISSNDNLIIFTEVKYRKNGSYGKPFEAVDFYKKRHIINTAKWFVGHKRLYDRSVRFDVAVWNNKDLKYYEGAFDCD